MPKFNESDNNSLSLPDHPVLQEVQRRVDGDSPQLKLALAIEGGGIRSTVTAGEVCALASSGIEPTIFDSHFGSSGGAYVSGYYLTGTEKSGATVFYENNGRGEFIDLRQIALRRRPVVNLSHILELVCSDLKPIEYQQIVDSRRLHILATKLADLTRHIFPIPTSVEELKDQLRAGSTIPAVAGRPVEIDGEQFVDAAVSEAMPYQAAIDSGYDAVLMLSSRPRNAVNTGKSDLKRKLVGLSHVRQIKKMQPEILEQLKSRSISDAKKLAELADKTLNPQEAPFVFSIHPAENLPIVNQLEKNPRRVIDGTVAGYLAVKKALAHPEPLSFNTEAEFYGIY